MSRCIDADILIQDTIQEYARSKQYRDAIIRMVNKAPTVEPKRGEWIWQSSMAGSFIERRYRCSNCHYEMTTQREEPIYNFCPNCGASMRGKDDE